METNKLKKFLEKCKNKIENKKQFLDFTKLIQVEKKSYLFRGQANSKWKLKSSAFRKKNANSKKLILLDFENKIKKFKDQYPEKDNLSLVSEIHHDYNNDIKSILIDFTFDFLNGLWFAFWKPEKEIELIKNQNNLKYRTLYLLKQNNNTMSKINNWNEKDKIYKCPLNNMRGIVQKSYFIIDNQNWDKNKNITKIYINNKLSEFIIEFLENKGVLPSTIFPDLKGISLEHENAERKSLEKLEHKNQEFKIYDNKNKLNLKNEIFYYNKGVDLSKLKKYTEAIKCYNKAIELNPNFTFAYDNKGSVLAKLKKYTEAIKCYNISIELNPKNANFYYNKAISLDELLEYNDAIKHYKKAIELNANFVFAYNNLGIVFGKLGKIKEEINSYDKAIQLDPNHTISYYNKAKALAKLEKYDEAIKYYDIAIKLNPNFAFAYNNKGNALLKLEKYFEALKSYEIAIKLDQRNEIFYYNKVIVLKKLGKYQ